MWATHPWSDLSASEGFQDAGGISDEGEKGAASGDTNVSWYDNEDISCRTLMEARIGRG